MNKIYRPFLITLKHEPPNKKNANFHNQTFPSKFIHLELYLLATVIFLVSFR